jgi:hypothetical protein
MCCVVWVKEGPERNIKILLPGGSFFQEATPLAAGERARRYPKTRVSRAHDATLDGKMP